MRNRKSELYRWPWGYRLFWRYGRRMPSAKPGDIAFHNLLLWSRVAWDRRFAQPSRSRGWPRKVVRKRRSWTSGLSRPWRYFARVYSPGGMRIWPPALERVRRWIASWRAWPTDGGGGE